MVDIFLTPDEYEIIEKWFGLIFGDKKAKKPKEERRRILQKTR